MKSAFLLAPMLVACAGAARTAAVVPPHVNAFDPTASDPAALAIADEETAAVGAPEGWTNLHELTFAASYSAGGQVRAWYHHKWDRWNGRHLFMMSDQAAVGAAKQTWFEVRYAMYDDGKLPYARNPDGRLADDSADQLAKIARQRLDEDGAWLTIVHRLHDPGVHLASAGTIDDVPNSPAACKPSCASVKVTFDPGAGTGTWIVDVNTASHKPELIEKVSDAGRSAFRIDAWTTIGALDWPTRLVNVAQPDQIVDLSDVQIGLPQDVTYEPPIEREQVSPVAVMNAEALREKVAQMAIPCSETCK
jgi:hypothetical protein